MISRKIITIPVIVFITMVSIKGQDVIRPLAPSLDRVTVEPSTGFALLNWLPGGSPDVGSYVIYTYDNNIAFAIDTIHSPYATFYTHTASAARYKSVTYVVAAMDSSLNISPLSNSLSTIFLTAVNDTCNGLITLSWTPYQNFNHPADGYGLYLSVDGAPAVLSESLSITALSYTLTGYMPDREYCFYVSAMVGSVRFSSSNRQCLVTGSEGAPAWTAVDAVAVSEGMVTVTGSYDTDSDINQFRAERLSGASGPWVTVASADGSNGSVSMADTGADTLIINLFRISAVGSCGTAVAVSSPVRNIVLTAISEGNEVFLRWNNPFPGEPAVFSVWRNTGSGFDETAQGLTDTVWSEDYRGYAMEISSEEVVYQVTATRVDAPAGTALCRSSAAVLAPVELIHVANAFTPDDNGVNDIFAPLLSFTALSYEFKVFNRLGVLLFRTGSQGIGWDGRYGGTLMPAGAYLWTLRLTTPSGMVVQKSGTVTILP